MILFSFYLSAKHRLTLGKEGVEKDSDREIRKKERHGPFLRKVAMNQ
jgi:hypothetical protein